MPQTIEYEEIKSILPHRYPFLLVDRVTHYEDDKYIEAYKNVTGNEPFFQGHFPEKSVMPGVLVIEAMAQAGGILLLKNRMGEGGLVYFTTIERARFRQPVIPGDQLRFEVTVLRLKASYCKLSGKAFVGDKLVAEAVFSSALSVK
jgi:3-hydroxyacyl-[acyl-carrier-protein] dehydratase